MPLDDNFFKNKKPEDKSKDKELIFWTVASALVSVAIIVFLFAFTSDIVNKISSEAAKMSDKGSFIPSLPFAPKRQTILLIGVDSKFKNSKTFKGVRSDTLILVNFDPSSPEINAVSIPRDSKVFIANHKGVDKINHAFAIGGAKLSIETIENALGINIDHYIAVNYQALKEIVSAIDGVPVYVAKNLYYTDKTAGLNINLKKGYRVLDADQAEQYVRFRHDSMADIGRMKRQQLFLRGVLKKFQSPEIITKIPNIVKIVNENVLTDMNFCDLSELAAYARGVNLNQIQISILPGNPSKKGRISYWILHPEKVQNVVDRLIYRIEKRPKKKNLTVGVAYEKSAIPKTIKVIQSLKAIGYKVKCTSKIKNAHTKIISHSNDVTLKTANYLKRRIPFVRNSQFVVGPEQYVCGHTDLSVVVTNK